MAASTSLETIMKAILTAAALLLAPALAHASTASHVPMETVTGRVHSQIVYCFRAPCPPILTLVDGDGNVMNVRGEMAKDLGAFDGAIVTVKGAMNRDGLEPVSFAPGRSSNFITGTVKDVTNCPMNARCVPQVAVVMNGVEYKVDSKLAHDLISITGATVTVRGTTEGTNFTQTHGTNVIVRGNLRALEHVLNGESHMMMFDDGNTMMIAGKPSWSDRNYANVWISGKFGVDPISNSSVFLGSKASRAIYIEPAIEPMPQGLAVSGANVGRNGDTRPTGMQPNPASAQGGAGVTR